MQCPNCRSKIVDPGNYCDVCGEALHDGPPDVEPVQDTLAEELVERCPNCHTEIVETAPFCRSCGHSLPGAEADNVPAAQGTRQSAAVESGPGLFRRLWDTSRSSETAEDLQYGQLVIIAARWVLVASGLLLTLWNPTDIVDLRVQIVVILGLAVANFYLTTQVLTKRPVLGPVVYLASLADLTAVSMMLVAQDGFASQLYVFYFPAILAFSVAFRTEVTFAYAAAAIATYGLIGISTLPGGSGEVLVVRLMMLAAVAVCGNVYWKNERQRRGEAASLRDELRAQVREGAGAP